MRALWGFDLDDVLCLTPDWRTPFRQTKRVWVQLPAVHARWPDLFAIDSDLRVFVVSLQEAGHRIAVVTGRRPWCQAATSAWLARWQIRPDHLLFKPAFERRTTPQFKLDTIRRLGCHVFVDDDWRNVEALRTFNACTAIRWTAERRLAALAELADVRRRLEGGML